MTAGKIIPIIDSAVEAGDQALREEFAAMINAIDAHIALLEQKLELKIEQLIAKRDEEDGVPHS